MLFSMRGTETAEVKGLWLINRPTCFVPEYPDNSPEVWWCLPFIVPSLYSMRDPHDIMKWCHNCLLWSSSGKTTVHVHQNHLCLSANLPVSSLEPQLLWMHLNLFISSLTWFLCLWHSPPGILVHPCTGVLIYLCIFNKTQARITMKYDGCNISTNKQYNVGKCITNSQFKNIYTLLKAAGLQGNHLMLTTAKAHHPTTLRCIECHAGVPVGDCLLIPGFSPSLQPYDHGGTYPIRVTQHEVWYTITTSTHLGYCQIVILLEIVKSHLNNALWVIKQWGG